LGVEGYEVSWHFLPVAVIDRWMHDATGMDFPTTLHF
jgi:hypothetical protein